MRSVCVAIMLLLLIAGCTTERQLSATGSYKAERVSVKRGDLDSLRDRFRMFGSDEPGAVYEVKLCADVPNNKDPFDVYYRNQPGHVFLILTKTVDTNHFSQVFGFYPVRPASVLIMKNTRSRVKNNSGREYEASISSPVSGKQFFDLLDSAIVFGRRKYNLNHFNCYDYGLLLYNIIATDHQLPPVRVKFPFVGGRGGSPVSLYKQLKEALETGEDEGGRIQIGEMKAPTAEH